MSHRLDSEAWLSALEGAADEATRGFLGAPVQRIAVSTEAPRGLAAAYLSLFSSSESLQIGFAAEHAVCASITARILGLKGPEAAETRDISDAVGELVNIMAGSLKRRFARELCDLQLGLPLFVEGDVFPPEFLDFAALRVRVGDLPATLVLMRAARGARP